VSELDVRNENPKYTDKSSSQQIGQVTPPTFLLWTDCSVRHNLPTAVYSIRYTL